AHGGEASHYVALDTVSGDSVTIMDPGSSRGNTFDDNYNDWTVDWYAIFYATDVPFGGSGSSSSDNSSSVTPANPSSFNVQHEAKWQHGDLPKDKVKYIVLHDTESGTDDAQAIINAWKNNVIASHFIVDKNGTIYQTVPIDKIAHHAGEGTSGANNSFEIVQERDDMVGASSTSDYAMNAWSIGIEMIHEHDGSEYPEAQLNAVDSLIAYLDQELGHTPTIIDHKGWSGSRKQDVDDSFPLEKYKTSRAHSGSANNCVTDGLSTDLGEGNKIDVPAEVPLRWGGTMQQSGISWDDVEYKNYLSGGSRLRWTAGEVYRAWVAAGTKSDKGLATLNGRYLAATSQMFGETGDAVDVVLESGHVIKLVMSDTKGEDAPSVWGHEQNIYSTGGTGISMVEWEGYEGYSSTNPAFPEWTEQKIVYVVNYGSYLSRLNN
ncbi:MAG: N-acetylmuramoyl-L-alanine amidase, partial [Methanobrevibacter sp.]|nr:N-acetylmuramoyl-L-alanine amidase [Methanobrevibacter sp.]